MNRQPFVNLGGWMMMGDERVPCFERRHILRSPTSRVIDCEYRPDALRGHGAHRRLIRLDYEQGTHGLPPIVDPVLMAWVESTITGTQLRKSLLGSGT